MLLAPGDAPPAFELDERIDTRFRIALVRTNLAGSERQLRTWIEAL